MQARCVEESAKYGLAQMVDLIRRRRARMGRRPASRLCRHSHEAERRESALRQTYNPEHEHEGGSARSHARRGGSHHDLPQPAGYDCSVPSRHSRARERSTPRLRLFVTDDGSTDGTSEAIKDGTGPRPRSSGDRRLVLGRRDGPRRAGRGPRSSGLPALARMTTRCWIPHARGTAVGSVPGHAQLDRCWGNAETHPRPARARTADGTRSTTTRSDSHDSPSPIARARGHVQWQRGADPRGAREWLSDPSTGHSLTPMPTMTTGCVPPALGVPIVQAPGGWALAQGIPPAPSSPGGLAARWQRLQSPTGLPWRAQARYLRRHGDWRWPVIVVGGQVRRVVGRTP